MSMFTGYDDLAKNYIPSNLNTVIKPPQTCTSNKPYEEVDELGNIISYWWYQGNTVDIVLDFSGEITLTNDIIVYTVSEEGPESTTIGQIDQYAYNIIDNIWWKCSTIVDDEYTWTQLEEAPEDLNITEDNYKSIYISIKDYLKDKQIQVRLYNFRWEQIDMQTFNGSSSITYSIDQTLADSLPKGIYHLSVVIQEKDVLTKTVYENPDIVCMIK